MRLPLTIRPSWRCLNLPARFCGRLYRVDILTLASLMTFRFNVRECPAIVAHTCNCPRAFFSRLDETLAYCADDAEMSFVCAHTNNLVCRLLLEKKKGKASRHTSTQPRYLRVLPARCPRAHP